MNTMKFAVTCVVDSEETIIRIFPQNEKHQALEFGKKIAENSTREVISCIETLFDENDNIATNECRVYEVWE